MARLGKAYRRPALLELSAPARQQIRAWLSETPTASSARNGLAIEKLPTWQVMRVPSMQLVPIERYRAQMRWQFLRGVLLGFGICTAMIITIFQFVGGPKPGSPVRTTASPSRAAQSSAAQTHASVTQPASPSTSVSQPTAAKLLMREPAALQTVPVAAPIWSPQRQSPQTAEASSTGLMTPRTSLASATPQSAKAELRLGSNQVAVAPAPAASKANSSLGQLQHLKKLPATPQQLWSAFEAGKMKAAVALADLYTRGEGVPVNCEQARILLQVASKRNIPEASEKLLELDKSVCPANSE